MNRELALKRIASLLNTNALVDADRERIFRLIRGKYKDSGKITIKNSTVYIYTDMMDDGLVQEILKVMDDCINENNKKLVAMYR